MEQDKQPVSPFYSRPAMNENKKPTGPFYSRPTMDENGNTPLTINRPKEDPPNSFATASMVLGIIAIVLVFTCTIYPPLILGALAIILALLSRGGELKFHSSAKTGIRNSIIAFVIDIALVAASCWLVFCNTNFMEDFDNTWEKIYGMPYEEMMEGIQNGTLDYEDIYENVYENMYEDIYDDVYDNIYEEIE